MRAPALAWIERWSLRAGLFLLPLGFSLDTYDQYVLPKLLIARGLVLVLLVLFVARVAISGQVMIKRTPLDLPLLAFVASAVLSTVVAENQNVAIFGTYARYDGLLTLLTYVALFWLVVQALPSTAEARNLLRVLLASGYAVAIVAILQSVNDTIRQGEVAPAFGSLGNANVLGAFLAMVFALACGELVATHVMSTRILIINVLTIVGLALLLSFSRSAWLGAAVGTAIVVAGARQPASRLSMAAGLAAILVAVVVVALVAGRRLGGGFELERLLAARALTLFDVSTWGGSRLHIWVDSLRLIASRPLAGYGLDNFGLVFPRFQTGDWGLGGRDVHQQIDKAHAETLQVAATQGLIGLAAYIWMVAAFVRSFWVGRRHEMAVRSLAAFAAYQVTIQLNFTALGSAFPFWVFMAAAITSFEAAGPSPAFVIPWPRPARGVAIVIAAGLVAAAAPAVVYPYLADSQLRLALNAEYAGDRAAGWTFAGRAAGLAPQESVYKVEVANVAIDRRDLQAARAAYLDAIRLGTYNPFVYRNLALVDIQLGRRAEALTAARAAVELNRFDPANQALLAQLEAPS